MRLRNMTTIYIENERDILMLSRENSKALDEDLWTGIGGHFESEELNDPYSCVIRELKEETGLKESDIKNVKLKYITIRQKQDEIRQQYIFFAQLKNKEAKLNDCDEGKLLWIDRYEANRLKMSITNQAIYTHYLNLKQNDDKLYIASVIKDNQVEITALAHTK